MQTEQDWKSATVTWLLASSPDFLIAWAYMASQYEGDFGDFLAALAVIWGIHLALWAKTQIGAAIAFRLHTKEKGAELLAARFLKAKMPKPEPGERAEDYFDRLLNDESQSFDVRAGSAAALMKLRDVDGGLLRSMRQGAMFDLAIEKLRRW